MKNPTLDDSDLQVSSCCSRNRFPARNGDTHRILSEVHHKGSTAAPSREAIRTDPFGKSHRHVLPRPRVVAFQDLFIPFHRCPFQSLRCPTVTLLAKGISTPWQARCSPSGGVSMCFGLGLDISQLCPNQKNCVRVTCVTPYVGCSRWLL